MTLRIEARACAEEAGVNPALSRNRDADGLAGYSDSNLPIEHVVDCVVIPPGAPLHQREAS